MRRRWIQSSLESWDPWQFTRENLTAASKADLVRFLRTFRGGAWRHLRSLSKEALVEMIMQGHQKWGFS